MLSLVFDIILPGTCIDSSFFFLKTDAAFLYKYVLIIIIIIIIIVVVVVVVVVIVIAVS